MPHAPGPDRVWYLVRHGETEWNAESRMQGQLDSSLTERGREQAQGSAALLARLGVDTMFASPLGRVRETVAIIAPVVPLPVTYDDRLKEWSSGVWSGSTYAEVEARWPVEFAAWVADRCTYRSPGGENFEDLLVRARSFVDDASRVAGARVAIIAHGFLNRALATALLSLPPREMLRIRQPNDTVIRIVYRDSVATVDHFDGGSGPIDGLPVGPAHAKVTA